MNLQEMLEQAEAKLRSMSIDEFETACIKAGFSPQRKKSSTLVETIDTSMYEIVYKISINVGKDSPVIFDYFSFENPIYGLKSVA